MSDKTQKKNKNRGENHYSDVYISIKLLKKCFSYDMQRIHE